jgi:superfamily II DNA or RNA helicase
MVQLEDLKAKVQVRGLVHDGIATLISVEPSGTMVNLVYKDAQGQLREEVLDASQLAAISLVEPEEQAWSFAGDGEAFRLVSEAQRIRLAHLFDAMLAVSTSLVEPLPHQITAVYGEMIPRQPLRFLLADDPGAGKTIMAGLLMRELLVRGDLHRCLVVCPGSLAAQWQDELYQKFHLPFELLTRDRIEAARTGNALAEMPLVIARLDQLSRSDDLQAKLRQTDWDLVVCDEAHKMSAAFFGREVKETKRYKLGKQLGQVTRHLLLMTATPHNGKEEDFQLFMGLLDPDRFEGRFRDGTHAVDTSDLMRRMVKEDLVKFDGKPLFPERRAYTVAYRLSPLENQLYQAVTDYVREEFNRADNLGNEGRKGTVGFALTILQRRLASSPEAIYQSLKRRRERLQRRVQEEAERKRRLEDWLDFGQSLDLEDIEDDFEDFADDEREAVEQEVVDQATTAQTIAELKLEITELERLEDLALTVKRSQSDRKWEQLRQLLSDDPLMFTPQGHRRKLVIFTEHRDTLNYLVDRIRTLLGRSEAVVTIHGGMGREARKQAETAFKQDVEVQVLLATDAAGEGINLQRAHLMVNYDLPWNPNRLEQRFGRIHRIGQTEVCHLWNLVAADTREGDVYLSVLRKLQVEEKALQGRVFDVLGKAISGRELRDLLIEAIRYGDRPETKAKLDQVVADRLDQTRLRSLLNDHALARNVMDASQIAEIRLEMERLEARKLQPHYIAAFFLEAFEQLGGTIKQRESGRYQVAYVPSHLRANPSGGLGEPILRNYERVCFEKRLINVPGKPTASFLCPGHPLLEAVIDRVLERQGTVLSQGTVLVDETDPGEAPRVMVALEHSIQDAGVDRSGQRRVVSRRMQYVEIAADGAVTEAGYAPYLDYRPVAGEEWPWVQQVQQAAWLQQDLAAIAQAYANQHLAVPHRSEIQAQREPLIDKTLAAVQERLSKEIRYWDGQANKLRRQEAEGKPNAKLNSARARARADELQARLERRQEELARERRLSMSQPRVVSLALVVPMGLLQRLQGIRQGEPAQFARETRRVEQAAMAAVMAAERSLGHYPQDVSRHKVGYDIESVDGTTGRLRCLEVKGRIAGATTVTVTKNEILVARNKLDQFILALVQVPLAEEFGAVDAFRVAADAGTYGPSAVPGCEVRYVRRPFERELGWGEVSSNFDWRTLWRAGRKPD